MDRSRLQELARHCHRYSPLVGLEESPWPESLWLDISGSEVLFGGEQGLAETLRNDLAQQGFQARVAIADSWGAAWGICHFGPTDIALISAGQQRKELTPLPIAALRITPQVSQSLQTLDIVTVGQLLSLPPTSLPSRFGRELVRRIDQALGLIPELLTAERLAEPFVAEWLFEEPVEDRQTLDHVCEVLLEQLLTRLDQRQAGLRELACHWLGTTVVAMSLRLLRPTTDRRHLQNLLRLQCERQAFLTGVHGVRMEVVELGLPQLRQRTLLDDDDQDQHARELAELVDRLSIRLGRTAVLRPRLTTDHQPEFACEFRPWLDQRTAADTAVIIPSSRLRCRPMRLLRTPELLLVQQMSAAGLPSLVNQTLVMRIHGPERIETGWWRGADIKRDYYRLELANGATLWVFIDRTQQQWFLQGLFD